MGLTIKTTKLKTTFNGPFEYASQLIDESGVYAISTLLQDGSHYLLDVGESHKVRTRIANHDRATQWESKAIKGVYASVFYCDEATRMRLEGHLRDSFTLPCGIR
jgi:hypothetical protein